MQITEIGGNSDNNSVFGCRICKENKDIVVTDQNYEVCCLVGKAQEIRSNKLVLKNAVIRKHNKIVQF